MGLMLPLEVLPPEVVQCLICRGFHPLLNCGLKPAPLRGNSYYQVWGVLLIHLLNKPHLWLEHLSSTFVHKAIGQAAKGNSSQDKALGLGVPAVTSASPKPRAACGDATQQLVWAESSRKLLWLHLISPQKVLTHLNSYRDGKSLFFFSWSELLCRAVVSSPFPL